MQTLTEQLIDEGFNNRVIADSQLARLITGTPQRRHSLVNRALKAGELLRLRRGTYLLAGKYRDYAAHPFALAQAFVPGSYVSFETALAWHGWIPEAVFTTASVTPGRKSYTYDHPQLGSFSFHPIATQAGYFLELVDRVQINEQTMSFIPKILVIVGALVIFSPWMIDTLTTFTRELILQIPNSV